MLGAHYSSFMILRTFYFATVTSQNLEGEGGGSTKPLFLSLEAKSSLNPNNFCGTVRHLINIADVCVPFPQGGCIVRYYVTL